MVQTAIAYPKNLGRSSRRVISPMMDKILTKTVVVASGILMKHGLVYSNLLPAAPIPATARPKIKKFTLGATPQKSDPISNHVTDAILRNINSVRINAKYNLLDVFSVVNREQ